jgi:16S rRNA (guanine1207-N2)-methyltransferase
VPGASHYFDEHPSALSRPDRVVLALPDLTLTLATDRGVFAAGGIDPGTKLLLLESGSPPAGPADLLDLGSGYGPIALTLARRAPEATVWAVDVNARARDLCSANAAAAGLDNVRVTAPEDVPADVTFAGIWSNPPIRIGKPALHTLVRRWLDRLEAGGVARFVVQKHLGADSLHRWLAGEGWAVERLASRMGYRVLGVGRP